jgi:4-hydroxyacetophenone monooxygenase
MLPAPNYHDDVTGPLHDLYRALPQYGRWYRLWQFILALRGWLPLVKVDPDWDQTSGSVSSLNASFRDELLAVLADQFTDRPDLYELCAPHYPPGTKRLLRDSGAWGRTLRKHHVHANTSSITRFDGNTLVTADGQETEVDIVVLATGFLAEEFLAPMQIRGRDGLLLEDWWKGDARAYATTTVPHFPNMFMLLGPNSGLAANGSMVFMAECAAESIVGSLETMIARGGQTIEPTEAAYHRFSDHLDTENRLRAWGVPGASTWYQNKYGRASQNWPLELADYWSMTHNVIPEDHVFE